MDDRLNGAFGPGKDCSQPLPVTHINDDQVYPPAAQTFDPFQRFFLGIAEVVDNGKLISLLEQFQAGMAADIPCPAGHQYMFHPQILLQSLTRVEIKIILLWYARLTANPLAYAAP